MSKGIDELKDWAMHNVRLISILPSNKNLPVDTKLTDVLEHDVDEKYFLSEERTAQLLKEFPRDLPDGVDGFNKADGDVSYALTTRTSACYLPDHIEKSKATLVSVNIVPVLTPDRIEKRQNGRRFKEDGEPMFTLTAQDRHGIAIREATKKGYTVAEPGDSVNISFPDSETRRGRVGKQTANTLLTGEEQGGVLGVGHHPFSKKREFNGYGDLSPTLIATDYKAPKTALMSDFRIRKLTPLECWRLQGFTDEQFYKAKNDGVSNSQLYKQAGNSVTVNVIDAIARRLT